MATKTPLERDIALIRRRVDAFARIQPTQDAYVQDLLTQTTVAPPLLVGDPFVWVDAVTITIPAQKKAVIKRFAMEADRPAGLYMVRWRFVINGAGGTNYQSPPVSFGTISQPSEIWIDADQQNTITLQFKNFDQTISYTLTTRIVLWSWDINTFIGARGL